jgi:hypothetical protein
MNTKTRIDFLEIGFWFLFLYRAHLEVFGYLEGVVESRKAGKTPSLYTRRQLCHALNTFVSLIIILFTSGENEVLSLDRLGSGSLEHFFGRARIRCYDVNTMKKMMTAFAGEACGRTVDSVCALTAEPSRAGGRPLALSAIHLPILRARCSSTVRRRSRHLSWDGPGLASHLPGYLRTHSFMHGKT